jgi:hypothetical protein
MGKMTKLECAKRFSSQATRRGLRLLSLALLAASAYATVISTTTTYYATGTFAGGDTLSGTITIGSLGITSEDLMINSGGTTLYTFTGAPTVTYESPDTVHDFANAVFTGAPILNDPTLTLDIYLGVNVPNFSGYTGGPLCSNTFSSCGEGNVSSFSASGDPNMGSGNLDPAPEPSTAGLLAFAGAGALVMLRRMKRRASLRRTLLFF